MRSLIPVLALLSFLALLGLTASVASAGPNAGGVLWVHDTGMVFSTDLSLPPESTPPANCDGVDNQQDADGVDRIWKVYAAFPEGSHPQLKSTGFGTAFPEDPLHPYIVMNLAGCGGPDSALMVSNGGFSIHPGEVWMTFPTARHTTVVELFYFTGAAFTGSSGEPGPTWCTVPLQSLAEPVFLDDAFPPNGDLILGYGCLGFGAPGYTPCPQGPPTGCCCNQLNGSMSITTQADCLPPAVWLGADVPCNAVTCPPLGACCFATDCTITTELGCLAPYRWLGAGVSCEPNPCPFGACCDIAAGSCSWTTEPDCLISGGIWLGLGVPCSECVQLGACCDYTTGVCTVTLEGPCEGSSLAWLGAGVPCHPNPCGPPPVPGACCDLVLHSCAMTLEADCVPPAIWLGPGVPCSECAFIGACCDLEGNCVLTNEAACLAPRHWHGAGVPCVPNPCALLGVCCNDATGACTVILHDACGTGSTFHSEWGTCSPNPCPQPPAQGACCNQASGSCTVTTQAACGFAWLGAGVPCNLTTCVPPTPSERTSWGRIKNLYR